MQRTKTAPPSRREIADALKAEVQQKIFGGTPSVSVSEGKVRVFWPDQPTLGGTKNEVIAAPTGSASALICALFPDKVLEMLMQGVDEIEGGIAATIRVRRIAEIEIKITQLEHIEEALITEALAAGLEVYRRGSASGWALLGLQPPQTAVEQMVAAE